VAFKDGTVIERKLAGSSVAGVLWAAVDDAESERGEPHDGAWVYPGEEET
jgi:hypothetical protein